MGYKLVHFEIYVLILGINIDRKEIILRQIFIDKTYFK